MTEPWNLQLPTEYLQHVIEPVAFEHHHEPSVSADKILGFDVCGERCFYFHAYTLTEEAFDVDEVPLCVDVYHERVFAWRLCDGRWLSIKSYADQFDSCKHRLKTMPAEFRDSHPR